ncbi:endonuclease/exonuclease/phosphatase family metal-dependent hydrolase [Dysgonomonadaceae bacterium PH5-43]|nr:endonuclease/exonuclease/phosphatase family metal-dependent hydrolase [Dysgonomonadaceae bacterium PH5-43]
MKTFKKFALTVITLVFILSIIVLLISAFSDRISPLRNVYISFFGLFFPFILGFNILFLIIWAIFKKWKYVAISFLVLIICSGSIRAYFPINFPNKEIPQNSIKVLTYNVMRFEHLRKHSTKEPNPILEYVKEQDPDIVCFQEFAFSEQDNFLTKKDIIKAIDMPYHSILFPKQHSSNGLAIFSKYPILSARLLPISSEYNGAGVYDLDINGKKVTLVNNHLESNKLSGEDRTTYYNMTTKDINSQKLEAFTHLMFRRLRPAFKKRARQAIAVREYLDKTENEYIIVCGDFNDTPVSYAKHKIKGNLKDAFVESGSGMGITFNRNRFYFRIDNILYSKNMKAYNCSVGTLKNSDHYPIVTHLEFSE